jgi:Ca2+-binding RTX toxin-like protein
MDGGPGDDRFMPLGGDDDLHGGTGNDEFDAGGGDDRITGGDGDDFLLGSEGNDLLDGVTGTDVARFVDVMAAYRLDQGQNGGWLITYVGTDFHTKGTDLVRDVELLRFDDRQVTVA